IILRVGRAAVHAAEVAAVCNRDAQVRNLAAEFIVKGHEAVPSDPLLKQKRLNPYAWTQAKTKKRTFSWSAPFQAGGPAVSSRTLIPGSSPGHRPCHHRFSPRQAPRVGV